MSMVGVVTELKNVILKFKTATEATTAYQRLKKLEINLRKLS